MVTLEKIKKVHDELGKSESFAEYLLALRKLGVESYDSFISDGHSLYFLGDQESLSSEPVYKSQLVSASVDKNRFLAIMEKVSKENMDYYEMMRELAESGVLKWTFDTVELTISYIGNDGSLLLTELLEK